MCIHKKENYVYMSTDRFHRAHSNDFACETTDAAAYGGDEL